MMKVTASCDICKDDESHNVTEIEFFGKKIIIKLDCGHTMVVWGVALTRE